MPVVIDDIRWDGLDEIRYSLRECPVEAAKAFSRALNETERRARNIVAQRIGTEYTIKPSDVKNGRVVHVQTKRTSDGVDIIYRGRTLTLAHFSRTPKTRPKRKYIVKAAIRNTGLKPVDPSRDDPSRPSRAFVGPNSIPFMRTGKPKVMPDFGRYGGRKARGAKWKDSFGIEHRSVEAIPRRLLKNGAPLLREPIMPVFTLSVPQMLGDKNVANGIEDELKDYFVDRFEHHFQFFVDKGGGK